MIPQEKLPNIFGLYIGCEAIAIDQSSDNLEQRKAYITGIHGEYQLELQFIDDNGNVSEEPAYSQFSEASILATSLSDITDEHVIEVCIYNGDMRPVNISDVDSEDIKLAKEDILSGFDGSQNGCIDLRNVVHIIDFLRSKRYALPAHGYSVEQLIEEGVFKIKQA